MNKDMKKSIKLFLLAVLFINILLLISCNNHIHTFDEGVVINEATCLIEGLKEYKCISCNKVKKETAEVIAVYVEYQTGNVHPGARRLFFENGEDEFNLLAPIITKEHVKMEVGKTYKIEYFDNSKVIKDYELIE